MIKRFLIVGRREIHLTKNVFCKSIFNGEETEKILSVVNNSNVDDLISQYVFPCAEYDENLMNNIEFHLGM